LKIAKGELSNQNQRMKTLEDELAHERSARENAEERARGLEQGERRDSPRDSFSPNDMQSGSVDKELSSEAPNLQVQLDRLRTSMDEMKQQMEAYRRRAETAETERDEVRQSLAEMIEQRRKNNSERTDARSPSHKSPRTSSKPHPNLADTTTEASKSIEPNGHAVAPTSAPLSPTSDILLERAGVEEGQPITPEQAKLLTQFLTQEILTSADGKGALWLGSGAEKKYHGREIASAMAVVFVGVALMGWMNGWVRTER
jgi:DNA repair exonuclease SbcCD ATPase subunit